MRLFLKLYQLHLSLYSRQSELYLSAMPSNQLPTLCSLQFISLPNLCSRIQLQCLNSAVQSYSMPIGLHTICWFLHLSVNGYAKWKYLCILPIFLYYLQQWCWLSDMLEWLLLSIQSVLPRVCGQLCPLLF